MWEKKHRKAETYPPRPAVAVRGRVSHSEEWYIGFHFCSTTEILKEEIYLLFIGSRPVQARSNAKVAEPPTREKGT